MKLDDLLNHCELTEEQLKQECLDQHLVTISEYIGCWETCAPHFELTEADIKVIKVNGINHEQRKLYMLRKWKEKKAFLATFGALVEIFLECGNAQMAQNVCEVLKKEIEDLEKMQCAKRQFSNQSNQSLQSQHSNQSSYRSQHSTQSFGSQSSVNQSPNLSYRSQHSNQSPNLSYRSQHSIQSCRSQYSTQSSRSKSFEKSFQYSDCGLRREESVQSSASAPSGCISLDPRDKELGNLCSELCHFLNEDEHALRNIKAGLVGIGFTGDKYYNAGDVCELLRNVRKYFNSSDISFLQTVIGFSKNETAVDMVKKYADGLDRNEEIPLKEEEEVPPENDGDSPPPKEDQSAPEPNAAAKKNPASQPVDSNPPNPPEKQQNGDTSKPTVEVDINADNVSSKFLEGVVKHLVCSLPCPLIPTCTVDPPPSPPVLKPPSVEPIVHHGEPLPGLIDFTTKVESESMTRGVLECLKSAVASTFCLDEMLLFFSHANKSSVLVHWHISSSLVSQIESVKISHENEERLKELRVSNIVLGGRCLYLDPVYSFSEDVRSSVGPIRVKYIATEEEFDLAVDEAADRPIVMEFFARDHPETMKIAPYFAKLSMEYLDTVFLLVDRDLCEDTASYFRVAEVPVFHFMKSRLLFPKLRIIGRTRASFEQLEKNVQEIAYEPLGDRDSSNFVNLNYLIEETQSECFNTDQTVHDILKKNKKVFMESYYDPEDEDETENIGKLLLYYSFPEAMKLHSIQILGPAGGQAPQDVQLFVNQDIRSFDDVMGSNRPFVPLRLSEADTSRNLPKTLPELYKFSNVRNLTVFVTSNQGGLPVTAVNYVGIFGEPKEGIGAREISEVDFSKFVACEAYKCPRHDK